MPEQLTIFADNALKPSEDYNFLRAEGIRLIEKLSGKVWTDYNSHDPGITLLEALCYALTDIGYRTSFDIKDILASGDALSGNSDHFFYTARQILPCNPVTLTDYRKLVIDTDGVKNAWIETRDNYEVLIYLSSRKDNEITELNKYSLTYNDSSDNELLNIRGLYKVTVEYEEDIITGEKEHEVVQRIRDKLNFHRNLCEDFLSICKVEFELFKMEADVQVTEGADVEKINAQIFQVIQNFFSPSVSFYTLQQMLEKGYTMENIFEGPLLKYGFIDTKELEKSERYMSIHLSDIINLISGIDGVIAVKKCIFPIETQSPFSDFTQWINDVKDRQKAPRLDIENSTVNFIRSGDRHRSTATRQPDKKRVKAVYSFLQSEKKTSKIKGSSGDINIPAGECMNIADYYPFQYSLPSCYGMQERIVNENIDDIAIEKAVNGLKTNHKLNSLKKSEKQILQLRGFLMVFEQILSDHLSQLANIKQLFSFNPGSVQTFFPQALKEINDMEMLFIDFTGYKNSILHLVETETLFTQRRNDILNHLLARFGEDMDKYGGNIQNTQKEHNKTRINNKAAFLNDYISISSYRGSGFNYADTDSAWNTNNVTGIKKRICRLLGIKDYSTRYITTDWIVINKVEHANNLVRYVVVLKDPDNGNILLESSEYESVSESREILKYMLQNGFNKNLYDVDARRDKYRYGLKRQNQEGAGEIVAEKNFTGKNELEDNFKKTTETLEKFSLNENFHVIEHILLRPKINPQEKTVQKDNNRINADAVDLLSVPDASDIKSPCEKNKAIFSYKFKLTSVSDPKIKEKTVWRLSLKKSDAEVLFADEDFIFRNHVAKRIEHIRRIANDPLNYSTDQNRDGYYFFTIKDKSKILAASKRNYQKKEEMDKEINSLVNFFSYELSLASGQPEDLPEDDVSSFDPYSFQVSLFIPDWPSRFRDPGFKHLLEKAIYMETPAHIYPHVYWLDYKQMKDFENTYKPWVAAIAGNEIPDTAIVNNLIYMVNELRKSE